MHTPPRTPHRVGHDDGHHHGDPLTLVALERHRELLDAADARRLRAQLPGRVRRRFGRFARG